MKRNTFGLAASLLFAAGLIGCGASTIPSELIDARRAYGEAQQSPAASLKPTQLHEAKEALARAESVYNQDGESQEARHLAYIAQRKAQRAQALGGMAYAARQLVQAQRDQIAAQAALQSRTNQRLSAELDRARQEIELGKREVQTGREQLAVERTARVQAEQRAKEAMSKLAEVASVREVPQRGTVITISGSVLFATGQWTLLPIAQEKLNQVAAALREQTEQVITIEGYTDSVGADDQNQQLSFRRAQAVRDYLVAQGVPAERVQAVGLGEASPVASNNTPEGRANNRRVEIVVGARGTGALTSGATRAPYGHTGLSTAGTTGSDDDE
ncbi:MAG TPA: OmpA family protein [Polyangiaceae bacterium]|nr:OmpA family protein [Polyangiaceae bacterium]